MDDLKRFMALLVTVHEGNLGDTNLAFEERVSTILGWDEERTRHVIQEAANLGYIECSDETLGGKYEWN